MNPVSHTPISTSVSPRRDHAVFASASLHRAQARHFILFDVVPLFGTVAAFASLPWLPLHPIDILLFFVFWLATGLGITVGYHRFFSHRSFAAVRPVTYGLLIMGLMAARGPMVSWAAMHRRHHELADRPGDMHSPNLHEQTLFGRMRGFLHAHVTWMIRHDYPNVTRYVPDLLRDKALMRLNRHYYYWVVLGLLLPALIDGLVQQKWQGVLTGFLWAGVVRIFVVEQTMSLINSACHLIGRRDFPLDNESRNNLWLGLVSWGESYHNNHHASAGSAAFGLRWYELDPGFWFIQGLEKLGLVWDVRKAAKTRGATSQSARQ